jgi:hypothetical protein
MPKEKSRTMSRLTVSLAKRVVDLNRADAAGTRGRGALEITKRRDPVVPGNQQDGPVRLEGNPVAVSRYAALSHGRLLSYCLDRIGCCPLLLRRKAAVCNNSATMQSGLMQVGAARYFVPSVT